MFTVQGTGVLRVESVPKIAADVEALVIAVEHVDRAPDLLGLAVQLTQQHERCDFCIPSIEDVSELNHDRIISRPHWNPTLHFSNPSELEASQRFVDIPVDVSDCTMTVFSAYISADTW